MTNDMMKYSIYAAIVFAIVVLDWLISNVPTVLDMALLIVGVVAAFWAGRKSPGWY